MASVKIKGFDPDDLIRQIKKETTKELNKKTAKVLDYHIGEVIEGNCTQCGNTTIEILSNGKGKCTKCGLIAQVKLNVEYR